MFLMLKNMKLDAKTVADSAISKLKEIRNEKNLTQEEVAFRAGMSQKMITYIETGARTPTLLTFVKICIALGTNPSEVFLNDNRSDLTKSKKVKAKIIKMIQEEL